MDHTESREAQEKLSNDDGKATFTNADDSVDVVIEYPMNSAKDDHHLCGIGSWRPSFLQKFADMRLLTMVLAIMSLLNGVVFAYYNAVITSIENRFGLSSSIMGFVKNVDNIGYVLSIVLVSHFCRFANKPRLFACACVLSAVSTALFGFPHFIYGSGDIIESEVLVVDNETTTVKETFTQFCDQSTNQTGSDLCGKGSNLLGKFNAGALFFFIASEFLQGVSNSPAVSLGITYVDDNMGSKSPKYFGKFSLTKDDKNCQPKLSLIMYRVISESVCSLDVLHQILGSIHWVRSGSLGFSSVRRPHRYADC